MPARCIVAVAFYGSKTGHLKELLGALQRVCSDRLGKSFVPYTLDQIHSTVVRLDGRIDTHSNMLVNEHYFELAGVPRAMNLAKALDILSSHFVPPLKVVIGGFSQDIPERFTSRGQHPYRRMFSAQGGAFVLVGWPVSTVKEGASLMPLDELRRKMNEANILHWYHKSWSDIDNDFHFVIGHYEAVPRLKLQEVTLAASAYLAENPIQIKVGVKQLTVVAADSPTLAPARFISRLPIRPAKMMELYG